MAAMRTGSAMLIATGLSCLAAHGLSRLERERFGAPEGFHDDCVDSLAMAVKLFKKREMYYAGNVSPRLFEQTSHWKMI